MMHNVGVHKMELCDSILSNKRGGIIYFVNSPVSTPKLGWQPLLLTLNRFSAGGFHRGKHKPGMEATACKLRLLDHITSQNPSFSGSSHNKAYELSCLLPLRVSFLASWLRCLHTSIASVQPPQGHFSSAFSFYSTFL